MYDDLFCCLVICSRCGRGISACYYLCSERFSEEDKSEWVPSARGMIEVVEVFGVDVGWKERLRM